MMRLVLLFVAVLAHPASAQPERFDGCSAGISASWRAILKRNPPFHQCCLDHDRLYAAGGSTDTRDTADHNLFTCVSQYDLAAATVMWLAVKFGGQPFFPLDWRQIDTDHAMRHYYNRSERP